MPIAVRLAASSEKAMVVDTIVTAFANDFVNRWCWPNPHLYLTSMPRFILALGGRAFEHGGAHITEDLCGASLWLPPGVRPDEDALGIIVEETVAPAVRNDLYQVLEQVAKSSPHELHWYLPLIGVDPGHQGKGHGSALLAYALRQCDLDRASAYLEATSRQNADLYQRH